MVAANLSGYMAFVSHLEKPVSFWEIGAVPLASLMHIEIRKGNPKPVIKKALVDCQGPAFAFFMKQRASWMKEDLYRSPGPMQFFQQLGTTDTIPFTFYLDHS